MDNNSPTNNRVWSSKRNLAISDCEGGSSIISNSDVS
jgi:hypothetical protein